LAPERQVRRAISSLEGFSGAAPVAEAWHGHCVFVVQRRINCFDPRDATLKSRCAMSEVKIENLSPTPFFARFLEGQFAKPLTDKQMQAIRGGMVVTQAAPSDQENVPVDAAPDHAGWMRQPALPLPVLPVLPAMPRYDLPIGGPTTLAYPSDQENVPV
jgi:hypothetical protein